MIKQNIESYFKSKRDAYIFILKYTQGITRISLLGITEAHYDDNELANQWYDDIVPYVLPSQGGDVEAYNILNNIYNVMTSIY